MRLSQHVDTHRRVGSNRKPLIIFPSANEQTRKELRTGSDITEFFLKKQTKKEGGGETRKDRDLNHPSPEVQLTYPFLKVHPKGKEGGVKQKKKCSGGERETRTFSSSSCWTHPSTDASDLGEKKRDDSLLYPAPPSLKRPKRRKKKLKGKKKKMGKVEANVLRS